MGRGRQKAKQTKVARELKYFSPETDYASLQQELSHGPTSQPTDSSVSDDDDELEEYADWAAEGRH